MTVARATQVDPSVTPYYHCITRCVRRAFLCGDDPYTGHNFDHRKVWVVERLQFLASLFTIDVCAYAVMSNHLHLVLRLEIERARALSQRQVVARYGKVFSGAKQQLEGLSDAERDAVIEVWRERLSSVSWMMRSLSEWIARRANREDDCTGRFWEGRFKSKPLLDETGLLTCMAYVDLNPHRAGLADSLDASDFTSIQARLRAAAAAQKARKRGKASGRSNQTPVGLAPMADDRRSSRGERLPIEFAAYVELLRWTAQVRARTGGHARDEAPPALLTRLGLSPVGWRQTMRQHELATCSALGRLDALDAEAKRRGQVWLRGKGVSKRLAS